MGDHSLGLLLVFLGILGVSYRYSQRFLDWIRFQSLGTRDFIVERMNLMFRPMDANQVLILLAASSLGPMILIFLLFLPQVFPGLLFGSLAGVGGWFAPRFLVANLFERRVQTFVLQLVDALSLMSNGLKSGLSVVQSLGLVTAEMPNPVKQEFNLILSENQLGVSLEEAFTNLGKRIPTDDVEMFVTSINILKETGGNLAETFDTIVTTIRDRTKVENKIAALTAQGFYQGVFVMMIPPILGVVFYQTDPEFMAPLFNTMLGWVLIAVIILLEMLGYFVIMRIVKIEV
jgi:tight adherence protein B